MLAEKLTRRQHTSKAPGVAGEAGCVNPKQNQYAVYFAPFGATPRMQRGMERAMRDRFGEGNFEVTNSKKLHTSPGGIDALRSRIRTRAEGSTEVLLGSNSIGGSNAVRTVFGIKDLESVSKNITIKAKISDTTEIKNTTEGLRYIGRYLKLFVTEMARLGWKGSFYRGVGTLSSVPPRQEIIGTEELYKGLREKFSELSHYGDAQETRNFVPDRDYLTDVVPAEERAKVDDVDRSITALLKKPEKDKHARRQIRRRMHKRAKLIHKTNEAAYSGKYGEHFNDPEAEKVSRWTPSALLGLARILKDSFITPKMRREVEAIKRKGVTVENSLIPEYEITRNRRDKSIARRVVLKGTTHTAPYAVQPAATVAAIFN